MKYIAVILVFFFGWFGVTPFSAILSTEQVSFGGRAQSGKTVQYQLKFIAKAPSTKLSFDGLWVGVNEVEMDVYAITMGDKKLSTFEKGDTVYINAYQRHLPNKEGSLELSKYSSKAVPIEYKGRAVLQYKFKGKTKYYTIEEFKKLPKVYYP